MGLNFIHTISKLWFQILNNLNLRILKGVKFKCGNRFKYGTDNQKRLKAPKYLKFLTGKLWKSYNLL